ncbi:MAG: hypothetical protein K0B08_09105 [Bacteroidales bacterium]|nr:hypothetical protein [Bacteroidales bacterium]
MKKTYLSILAVMITAMFISGCLTCEKKEYSFVFTGENSGRLTIKYINLLSTMDDGADISQDDFQVLLNDYYDGYELENEFPNATVVEKRLFEENGVLCGEIVFEFDDLVAANLYRYRGTGPIMYCLSCYSIDSEYYAESNGEYGGDIMPVVFWEAGLKKLSLTTDVTSPDETTASLLAAYKDWKAGR